MASTSQTFSCPGCGQSFAWKPVYAGKKVTCRCGQTFVPEAPGEQEDLYDLAGDVPATPPPAPPPPITARPAPVVSYRSGAPERVEHAARAFSFPWRELSVPALVLVIGFALWLTPRYLDPQHTGSPVASGIALGAAWTAFSIVLMFASLLLSAKLMDIQLGSLGSTVAKLTIIATIGTVAFVVGTLVDREGSLTGYVMAFNVMVIIYWLLFSGFFQMNFAETMMTVALIAILQAIAAVALVRPWWSVNW